MRALTILWSNFGALVPFTISSLGLGSGIFHIKAHSKEADILTLSHRLKIRLFGGGLENESSHGDWGSRTALRGGMAGQSRVRPQCPPACLSPRGPDTRLPCLLLPAPAAPSVDSKFLSLDPVFPFPPAPRPMRVRARLSICLVRRVVRRLGFSMQPAGPHCHCTE